MKNKRPVVITIAVICLVLLVAVSSGLSLAGNLGLTSLGANLPGMAGGGFLRQGGEYTPLQEGEHSNPTQADRQPGENTFIPGGRNPDGMTSQIRPFMQSIRSSGGDASSLFRIFSTVTISLHITVLVLGVLAAIGLWKQKKWAAILAILLAGVLFLVNLPGLTRIFMPLLFGINLLKVLLAVTVIILLLLPAARSAYAPNKDLDLLEGLE